MVGQLTAQTEDSAGPRPDDGQSAARRRRTGHGRLTALLLVAACSFGLVNDPDMWWHIRTGEWIVGNGIPRGDVFSFAVPGRHWITHEWGSQIVFWLLYDLGGLRAIQVFFAAVTAAAFFLVYASTTVRTRVIGPLIVLAAVGNMVLTRPRPMMFNTLLLAVFGWVIFRVRQGSLRPVWLWALVPLTVVWANLHSGYQVGVVLIAAVAVGDAMQRRWSRDPDRALPASTVRHLGLIAVVSFAASALNANGIALWRYPIDTFRSDWMREHLKDWERLDPTLWVYWPVLLVLALVALVPLLLPRRITYTEALLAFGASLGVMLGARHLALFLVIVIPVLAQWIDEILDARGKGLSPSQRRIHLGPVIATGLFIVLVSAFWFSIPSASFDDYPVAAVDALVEADMQSDRVFNEYTVGGYMIHRGFQVYADGRADMYGDDHLYRYQSVIDAEPGWEHILDEDRIDAVLAGPQWAITQALSSAPGWVVMHEDPIATVYVRAERGSGG